MEHGTHVTLSKTSLAKVLDGHKTIISCWFDGEGERSETVRRSQTVHLKTGNGPASAKAVVSDVLEFSDLTPERVHDILEFYGADDGIAEHKLDAHKTRLSRKKFCTLIFLESVEVIESAPIVPPAPTRVSVDWLRRPLRLR